MLSLPLGRIVAVNSAYKLGKNKGGYPIAKSEPQKKIEGKKKN